MEIFQIKQGARAPSIRDQIVYADGSPVDISDATSPVFTMYDLDGAEVLSETAQITGATDGYVAYDWQAGDTDTVGTFRAVWQVTLQGGEVLRAPVDGYRYIEVTR